MSSLVHQFFSAKGRLTNAQPNAPSVDTTRTVHIAVQGCCHGELDKIYAACAVHESQTGQKISFLVCCGDFQAIRDTKDLQSMAVPEKYKVLGDFAAYYRGEKKAPYLTLFIGGNHEASDWLAMECYGGYLAPNIYYLGHSSVVVIDGCVTVAGISGIFKGMDYKRPYPRRPFYSSEASKRSAYHVRRIEVEKLTAFAHALGRIHQEREAVKNEKQKIDEKNTLGSSAKCAASFAQVDLFVSHDWPVGVTKYGEEDQLLRHKPFFADDIRHNALGNPYTMKLLRDNRPQYWISAHLHCRFEATIAHPDYRDASGIATTTKFLALDKCSKGTGFVDFIDISVKAGVTEEESRIMYHPLWLEVLRDSHSCLAENDCTWSAASCALAARSPAELSRLSSWVPGSDTKTLLNFLGLQPSPLQYPLSIKRGPDCAGETETKTAVAQVERVKSDALTWVEDTTGAS